MKAVTLHLKPAQYETLRKLAYEAKVSMSKLSRTAIEMATESPEVFKQLANYDPNVRDDCELCSKDEYSLSHYANMARRYLGVPMTNAVRKEIEEKTKSSEQG